MSTVSLLALQAGHFTMSESSFIHPSSPSATRLVPSLSFLITHTSPAQKVTRILFDLGLRRIISHYPQQIQNHMQKRQPYDMSRNVLASLQAIGLSPDDIDHVILSHVHWDHVGMPSDFERSVFVVGPGSRDVLEGRTRQVGSHAVFEMDLLPVGRMVELRMPGEKGSVGEGEENSAIGFSTQRSWRRYPDPKLSRYLEHTVDLFGDGLISVVDAPGHLQGHVNLLVKTSEAPTYVYLAGDACHDRRLLRGEKEIAEWEVDGTPQCIHIDKTMAKETIKKIAELEDAGVEVIIAHDKEREEQQTRLATFDRVRCGHSKRRGFRGKPFVSSRGIPKVM